MKKISIRLIKGAIVVNALLTGKDRKEKVGLILDTGASKTVIGKDVVKRLGYKEFEAYRNLSITTARGVIDTNSYKLASFEAMQLTRRNFEVAAHNLPLAFSMYGIDGLLGLDFIRNHVLTINLKDNFLLFD